MSGSHLLQDTTSPGGALYVEQGVTVVSGSLEVQRSSSAAGRVAAAEQQSCAFAMRDALKCLWTARCLFLRALQNGSSSRVEGGLRARS